MHLEMSVPKILAHGCLLWHSRLWSFQGRDTKLERFLAKKQLYQMKLPNFEKWSNGELSKSTKI